MPKSDKFEMKIEWNSPALKPNQDQAYQWTKDDVEALGSEPSDGKIERDIGLPKGTIGVLRHAFDKHLNRSITWDLNQLKGNKQKFIQAARMFKRGVPVTSDKPAKATKGSYNLTFAYDKNYVFNKIHRSKFVVADARLIKCWPFLEDDVNFVVEDITEMKKNFQLVVEIVKAWKNAGQPTHWLVLGGGILTDVAAFAADLCGCKFVLIPTTLLSMSDASVGGKSGINFERFGKNQVGSFAFPKEVVIWRPWLQTLKMEEVKSGGTECLKHSILIGDRTLSNQLAKALQENDNEKFDEYLPKVVDLKRRVVIEDSTEKGRRAILNFGHTLAHALEARSQKKEDRLLNIITHGQAVAVGMCFAAYVSHHLYHLSKKDMDKIVQLLEISGCLPTKDDLQTYLVVENLMEKTLWFELLGYMEHDKKVNNISAKTLPFVLLKKFGKVERNEDNGYTIDVPKRELGPLWKEFIAYIYYK